MIKINLIVLLAILGLVSAHLQAQTFENVQKEVNKL